MVAAVLVVEGAVAALVGGCPCSPGTYTGDTFCNSYCVVVVTVVVYLHTYIRTLSM